VLTLSVGGVIAALGGEQPDEFADDAEA